MTDYVKSTNFASKDALATGNPLKIVKGTEIDTEFNNIATAVATKADLNSPALLGTPTAPTASAGTSTTQLATTAFVGTAVTNERTATATLTNKTLTSPSISSPTMTGTPVAPTATAGTDTTQIATTAFVKTAIDNYDTALTVSTAQIESSAVTTAKIADSNVTTAKIADSNVTTTKIADSNVTTAKIADSNVTTAKIADSNVTTAKLASGERMTTANVAGATAGVSAGDVGTYMLAVYSGATAKNFGDTAPGSELRPTNATGNNVGSYQTGTWRCMGYSATSSTSGNLTTLWLRIS